MNGRHAVLVGLCGRSGAGKGYVASLFSLFGIPSVDTDAVYRTLTAPSQSLSPCMKALRDRFGDGIVCPDNSLNRPALRALVFGGDGTSLNDLNAISHRFILLETERIADALAERGADVVLIDAPELYESGFDKKCARVVCVTAPEDVSIRRITERDGLSPADAKRRLDAQMSNEELRARADYAVENDGSPAIFDRVARCAAELLKLRKGAGGKG